MRSDPGERERTSPFRVRLSSRRLPRILWTVVAGLVAVHLALQGIHHAGVEVPWDLHLVFNVDDEPTVPTWYSSAALLFASVLVFLIAGARRTRGERDTRLWYGLAAGFAFLSLDEIAAFHEMFNTFMAVEWTIPAAIVALLVAVVYTPFVWRLPPRFRNQFVLAGAVFLSGALVVEYLTGPQYFRYDIDSMPYAAITALEEGLEMSGVVLFIGALLRYMEEEGAGGASLDVEVGPAALKDHA